MSVTLTVNGIDYQYPENNDINWGTQATAWATAVTNSSLQKNGGAFTLTADANFGTNFGLVSKYFKSNSSNIASTGSIRLSNTDTINFRNSANTADLPLAIVADKLTFNTAEFIDATSTQTLTNKTYNGTSLTLGGGTALTTTNQTGTGNLVLATSPTLVTPVLGVASATSIAVGGGTALTTTNSTGTGNLVKATSPSLTTPDIGVATGTSLAIAGGTALTTTNATGTGNLVKATSPTLVTPVLGVATATSVNKLAITAPATSATLSLADGSTLATSGAYSTTLTVTGPTTVTLPTSGSLITDTSSATLSNKNYTQTNSATNATKMIDFSDFMSNRLISGLIPSTSANLISNIPSGTAYITGVRVPKTTITNRTWTASRDTYVDLNSAGTFTYVEVTNGAAAPALTGDSLRICMVETDATVVVAVTQLAGISTAFGLFAGRSVTTGYENTLFGNNAGELITTGFSNTCFGPYAGAVIAGGYENICFGGYTGMAITSGFDNVCIGSEAGSKIIGGDNNVFIGYKAGTTGTPANGTTSGSTNIFIGSNTGSGNATQRTNSICIGDAVTTTKNNTWTVGKLGTQQAIKEGTNAAMGASVLVAGTVTVANTKVTATSRIFITSNVDGGTPGFLRVSARTAGTSFTITSSSGTDTSTVAWEIKEVG